LTRASPVTFGFYFNCFVKSGRRLMWSRLMLSAAYCDQIV
jgi:hypothetical protein